jgi:hypothetical protein
MAEGDGGLSAIGTGSFAKAGHSSVRLDTKAANSSKRLPSRGKTFEARTFVPTQEQWNFDEEKSELFSMNSLDRLEMH